jgi:hypothetical protein
MALPERLLDLAFEHAAGHEPQRLLLCIRAGLDEPRTP